VNGEEGVYPVRICL